MANTYVDYTGADGTGTDGKDFNFSFEYLRDEHVKVKVNDVIVTNYTIVTSPVQLIRFDTAPAAGATIKIYRDSRGDFSPLVDFVNGSVLTENELDEAYRHNLFVSQEASEGTGNELLSKKGLTHYDAEGNKIINLGTPTASTDAVTKAYVEDQDFADRAYIDALGLDHFDGSKLSATVDMNGNRFTNVADPIGVRDVTNKQYVTGVADQLTLSTGAPPGFSTFTQSGTDTDFTLTFTPNHSDSQSYLVTVNGTVQSPNDYTIVGGLNVLRFDSAPALSASIVIVERGYRYAYSYISNTLDYGSVAVVGADDYVDYGAIL